MGLETMGVELVAKNLDKFTRDMGQVKNSMGAATTATENTASGFGTLTAAVAIGTAIYNVASEVIVKVGKALMDCGEYAAENQTAMMHLNSTLESTGRVSEVSSEHIADIAENLMKMSTFDDEEIVNAYNAIAKFENIDTGDMDRLVKTAMDMTIALSGDLASNANDIARVLETGIIPRTWGFSTALKEEAKQLYEAGDTGKLLTLVLDKLNHFYGGQAAAELETYSGKVKRVDVAWGELKENIGRKVLPIMEDLADQAYDVIKTLDLLVTWTDQVDTAYTDHEITMRKTAQTYSEYADEMLRAKFASMGMTEATIESYMYQYKQIMTLDELSKQYGFLTTAEWETARATLETSRTFEIYGKTANQWMDVILKKYPNLTKAIESSKTNWSDALQVGLTAAKEYSDYTDKITVANAKLAEDEEALAKLRASGWKDYSQNVIDAMGVVEADKIKIKELQIAHRDAMNEMIVGWMQQRLAADANGFTEADMQTILNYKYTLGLLTKEEYDAAQNAMSLYTNLGLLPKQTTASLDFFWSTWYTQYGTPPTNAPITFDYANANVTGLTDAQIKAQTDAYNKALEDYAKSHGAAKGLSGIVPAGFPNDSFPIFLSSGEFFQVLTKQQQQLVNSIRTRAVAAPAQVVGGNTYNRTNNYKYSPTYAGQPNNPSFDFAIMQARGEL